MKKTRALLLSPPTAVVSRAILLSLAYLAASLRKAGHEARIIDATAAYQPYNPEQIKKIILEYEPHFIGVTLSIANIAKTYFYLQDLREMGVPIVAGGPHPNSAPEEVLDNGVDIVAIGEGENTIVELAEYFLGDKPLKDVAGLCFVDKDDKISYTAQRQLIKDLDSIPFPDFGDFPIEYYTGSNDVNSNPVFWSVFTSRGCPYNCIFCSSHNVFGRTARLRSAKNVFDEIENLVNRFGVERIAFQDDEILCSKKRFLELCDLISRSNLKIKISIRTRIDSIDKEILINAKKAGVTRISFGIESWNDDTLKRIKKKYTVNTIAEKFKTIEESKMPFIYFNNICGFPWETWEHYKVNLLAVSKIPKSIGYFTGVVTPIPYPKTELYELYHREFGFSDWWLDIKKHDDEIVEKSRKPFFMHFAFDMNTLYMNDSFWNYSNASKRAIKKFSWGLFHLFVKRHFRWHISLMILVLCRISNFLWKISPRLELKLFYIFPELIILKLEKKLRYVHQG